MFNLNVHGYVYKVTDLDGRFYIGSRTFRQSDGIYDIGKTFWTGSSNKDFVKKFKANPENYEIEILHSGVDFVQYKAETVREIGIHFKNSDSLNLRYFSKTEKSHSIRMPSLNRKRTKRLAEIKEKTAIQTEKQVRKNLLTPEEKQERAIKKMSIKIADISDKLINQKRKEINAIKNIRENLEKDLSLKELKYFFNKLLEENNL